MAFNLSGLANLFTQIDTHVDAFFVLDGKEYEIEQFNIGFSQSVDHKGQPQNETKGGQLSLTFTQFADDNLYDWAKRENKGKTGKVLFKSRTEGTVLEIVFTNANCVQLNRTITTMVGTTTSLVIAPQTVTMNGIVHDNKWRS